MASFQKVVTWIWFDKGQARKAAEFYTSLLPNSEILETWASPADNPSAKEGEELVVEWTLSGIRFAGLNGGPMFKHSEAMSISVTCVDQEETDRLWNAIVNNGGSESECGWCRDKWGVSWQIQPKRLIELMNDSDRSRAKKAMQAMMTMKKIDIAKLDAAVGS